MSVRMDNVAIIVEDLEAPIAFFQALGLVLDGRTPVDGQWAGRVTGLGSLSMEIAVLRTPDGHGRVELTRFDKPQVTESHQRAPVNSLGYLRVMFEVEDLDAILERLEPFGTEMVSDEVVNYADVYRLCYVRGPQGILVALAQSIG